MKRIITTILLFSALFGYTQSKNDTVYRTSLMISYQPAIANSLIGFGIYVHNIIYPVGIYGSIEGIFIDRTRDSHIPATGYSLYSTENKEDWENINIGLTFKMIENFYIYGGYSTGNYRDWVVATYTSTTAGNQKVYTIAKVTDNASPGVDFGAIYYAGLKGFRCGLQLGFNTAQKTIIAGIQIGGFFKHIK